MWSLGVSLGALADKVANLPALPGVYLWKDPRGTVLYVGKAKSLAARVRSYVSGDNSHPRLRELMAEAADLDTILTATEAEALLLEATLIKQHKPHYNVLLKDDKSFPYVRISVQEDYPRLSVTRQVRDDGARYLGPYTDVKHLRRTLREVRRIFPVRTCRNFEDYRKRNRPCLYYHIRRCAGPCTTRARLTRESYRAIVDGLLLFLTGRDAELLRTLQGRMAAAAAGAPLRGGRAAARPGRDAREGAGAAGGGAGQGPRHRRAGPGAARRRAAVALLLLRGGRVVGKESRLLDRADLLDDGALVQQFLTQHYLGGATAPRQLVVAAEPAEAAVTLEAVSARAGHRVEMLVPQRGRARQLLRAAERNAAHALEDLAARAAGRRGALLARGARAAAGAGAGRAAVARGLLRHLQLRRRGRRGRGGGGRERPGAHRALPAHAPAPAGPRRLRHDRRGGRALLDARRVGGGAAARPGDGGRRRRARWARRAPRSSGWRRGACR